MSLKTTVIVAALALTLALGAAPSAFAKAHDQGVADGLPTPDNTGETVQNNGIPGISETVNEGTRGEAASENRGENRVEPVVGKGKNAEPD